MKKNFTLYFIVSVFVILTLTFISYRAITYSGGPSGGLTNAPGENNCTSCHSGSLITSGTNWSNMTLNTDIPNTGYIPDSVYTITLSQSQSGISTWGFQITALQSSNNNMAGSFTITNSVKTQKKTSGSKEYVTHTSSGTSGSGSNSWSFSWKAPSANVGDVKFYAVVNAANGDGMTSGDQIYARNWTFSVSSLLPTAVITPSKTSICVGDTLFLSGSGNNNPTGFEWSMPGGTPSSSTSQNTYVVYTSSGTKTITLTTTNNKGKSLPATLNITVNALPTATITVTGNTTFCPGDSVLLSAPSGNGLSYLWSTGEKTRSITVKSAGTYWVKVTNASGCSSVSNEIKTAVHTVLTNKLASQADSICQGSSVTLMASPGFNSYTFYDGNSQLGTGTSNSLTTASLSGNNHIFCVAVDSNGCKSFSNSLSIAVVQPAPAPVIFCGKKSTSSVSFVWNKLKDIKTYEVSLDTGKTWINVGKDTFYSVTGLNYSTDVFLQVRAQDFSPCGLTASASQICQSEPCSPISYTITHDSVICQGDSARIVITGISSSSYALKLGNSDYTRDTVFYVKPLQSTNYLLSITDSSALNCPPILKNIRIEVENMKIDLSNNLDSNRICEGKTAIFTASKDFANYQFYLNQQLVKSGKENQWITDQLNHQDMIYVTGTSLLGCQYHSDTQRITVFPASNLQLTSDKNNHTVCEGQSITLLASPSFTQYYFILNNTDTVYSGKNHTYNYSNPGNNDQIKAVAIDPNGCEAKSQPITIRVNPLPDAGFTYTQNNLTFTFTDTTSHIASRVWNFGDMQEDTSKIVTHTYALAGKYMVMLTVTDNKGCTSQTSQEVNAVSSDIDKLTLKGEYLTSHATVKDKKLFVEYSLSEPSDIEIMLINLNGQKVATLMRNSKVSGSYRQEFSMAAYAEGIYFIRVISEKATQMHKIILP